MRLRHRRAPGGHDQADREDILRVARVDIWYGVLYIVSKVRIISGGLVEFIGPSVDDRMSVELVHGGHDAILEFLLGCDAHATQHWSREFGEEALAYIEPGPVLWIEVEFEASSFSTSKPILGL